MAVILGLNSLYVIVKNYFASFDQSSGSTKREGGMGASPALSKALLSHSPPPQAKGSMVKYQQFLVNFCIFAYGSEGILNVLSICISSFIARAGVSLDFISPKSQNSNGVRSKLILIIIVWV